MKKNIIEDFKLPNYIKGKSFAEASKLINKKFEDRTDNISQKTKEELLTRLANAQEYTKELENVSVNKKALGGAMDAASGAGGANGIMDSMGGVGGAMSLGMTALDFGKDIFGKTDINGNSAMNIDPSQIKAGNSALSSGLKGAQAGMALGPWGAAAGAAIGGIAGLIKGNKEKEAANKARQNYDFSLHNNMTEDFGKGGYLKNKDTYVTKDGKETERGLWANVYLKKKREGKLAYGGNMYNNGGLIDYDSIDKTFENQGIIDDASLSGMQEIDYKMSNPNKPFKDTTVGKGLGKVGDYMKENYGDILRYAPVATNALQLAGLKKPGPETLGRLNDTYTKADYDLNPILSNIENQYSGLSDKLANASGGSASTLRSNLLGAYLNKTRGISDVYEGKQQFDANQEQIKQQFDLGVNKTNLQQSNAENDINARNLASFQNNKSKLLSQIGTDLGNIGKERVNKKQAEKIFGYDWKGNYKANNPKATEKEVSEAYKKELISLLGNSNMYGGYLKKK